MPLYGDLKFPRRQYLRRARYSTFSNSKLSIAERLRRVETRKGAPPALARLNPARVVTGSSRNGKPAVMEHTGPSRMLPDGAALFVLKIYAFCLETAAAD